MQGELFSDASGASKRTGVKAQAGASGQPAAQPASKKASGKTSADAPENETGDAPRPPADAEQRELAITEFERPVMLEAGAGTGKTATLVARIVCWCVGVGWEASASAKAEESVEAQAAEVLASIAAITFTEAAAAEMSTRVSEALGLLERASGANQELDPAQLPTGLSREHLPDSVELVLERSAALRGALEHLNVSTIHAFCRRILASNPLEVGLAPGFEVDADGQLQREAVRAAMERYLAQAWQAPIDPDLLCLAREGFGAPELEEHALQLLQYGALAEDLALDPFDAAAVESLLTDLEVGAKELAILLEAQLGGLPASQTVHDLIKTLGELLAIFSLETKLEDVDATPSARLERLNQQIQAAWNKRGEEKLKKYVKGELNKGEAKLLGEEAEPFLECAKRFALAAKPFKSLQPALLNSGRRILHGVLADVESELRRRGVVTFNDLLGAAHQLLTQHPAVAARERRRMGMLMVDEFQDTDQAQCDLVRVLALEGPEDERPSLFIVGDPKQSIFAFRSADLAAYDAFKASLTEAGGRVLQLTCNFRSRPAVLEEVSRVMQPVMLEEPGMQPPFVALEAYRSDAPPVSGQAPIEHWASWPQDPDGTGLVTDLGQKKTVGYQVEGRAIAADIWQRHRAGGVAWSDFALIFRTTTGLEHYLGELRRLGIPFETQKDKSFYRRREIIDASALLRAALDPSDLLALVTLLRSPMVGLPDAALLPLWERGFPGLVAELAGPDQAQLERLREDLEQVAAQLPGTIPGIEGIRGWELSVHNALEGLARARANFQNASDPQASGFDAWVDQLRAWFLPDATEAARYLGPHRLANLERFFDDQVERYETLGGDTQALLRSLRSNIKREEQVNASPPGEESSDTVKVLTIHGSKGLEYSQVYLPQLSKGERPKGLFKSSAGFDRQGGQVSYELFRASTPNRSEAAAKRERTERAERVRLFYVAMTRAKNRLVLLSGWSKADRARPWDQAPSLSALLSHRPGAEDARAALAAQAPLADATLILDPSDAGWRLAALVPTDEEQESSSEDRVPLPALALTEAKLRRCAELRAAAEAYVLRPYTSQASAQLTPEEQGGAFESSPLGELDELAARHEPVAAPGLSQAGARRVGTEVHRVLEHYDPDQELESFAEDALQSLPEDLSPAELEAIGEILQAIDENGTLQRLRELAPHVVARELPVLLPPSGDAGPSAFQSGAVDLVYRDPESQRLVVVDYKTDRIADEAELQQHAQAYRAQGLTYARALQQALALEELPRLELWFLRSGHVASLQA